MAVKVMHAIWEHATDVQGSDLVLLLALADWADDEGVCWPSLPRLAAKARVSVRTAQYILQRLTERGYVAVRRGGGRHHPNCYTVRPSAMGSGCAVRGSGRESSSNAESRIHPHAAGALCAARNPAPTPAEALWQTIARALDRWQPGHAPPPLPPEAAAVIAALGGFPALAARRPSWPVFLAACNRVRRQRAGALQGSSNEQ